MTPNQKNDTTTTPSIENSISHGKICFEKYYICLHPIIVMQIHVKQIHLICVLTLSIKEETFKMGTMQLQHNANNNLLV